VTDVAGNPATSASVSFTVDTLAPAVPLITAPTDGSSFRLPTPTISGTGENGATVTVTEGGTVLCTAVVVAGVWNCTTSPLADGLHTIFATQRDVAGNTSPPSEPLTLTIDTVAPAAPVITPPPRVRSGRTRAR
jgi:hypothetical protein